MNPFWMLPIYMAVKAARVCPHCQKRAVYPRKKPGQFHLCKFCQHRFKENEK